MLLFSKAHNMTQVLLLDVKDLQRRIESFDSANIDLRLELTDTHPMNQCMQLV